MKKIIQPIALLLLLIILPFGSWYYLNSGYNYQKKIRAELKDYGKAPAFRLTTVEGNIISDQQLKGKMSVATFGAPAGALEAYGYLSTLEKLHEQFDERNDLVFLTFLLADQEASDEFLKNFSVKDTSQCIFITGEKARLETLAKEGYRLPLDGMALEQNPFLALVDTASTIRHYYDMRDIQQIRNLVEHIAMILPRDIPEDPKLKRKREK